MGALDAAMGKVASSILTSLGGSGTYIRAAMDGSYDPAYGDVTDESAATSTSCAVGPGPAAIRLFDQSLIEEGDRTAIVARTEIGARPRPGADKLVWKGETWTIEGATPYGSGDEDAAYALLLRR